VSVDKPRSARKLVDRYKLPFPLLSDESREVVRRYGLVHAGGGPDGQDIPVPALLIIDTDGRIEWAHVARRVQDRVNPDMLLEHLRHRAPKERNESTVTGEAGSGGAVGQPPR